MRDIVRKYGVKGLITLSLSLLTCLTGTLTQAANFAIIEPDDSEDDIIAKAANVTPSPAQYRWQTLEFTAFLHFTINTFTDKEWGDGTEDPSLFNPADLNASQWVKVLKDAGMKQVILTCKHHDGFCLWPSNLTDHSVKSSPWKNGDGDVVRELSDACREAGLGFGVYLSPWDRHEPCYGDSPRYNEFFKNQLRELLTRYGDIAEVWFDGACGEGPNGKRQVYDWPGYYKVIRELQPDAVIAIMGPDVRWVGTESGYGRLTEWSVLPAEAGDTEAVAKASQKDESYDGFKPRDLRDEDLGSREKISDAKVLVWYPSEVDVSIRPGWFYHKDQDDKVKTPEKLVDIYFSSIGRNSLLLLNIPPDTRGLIHENDAANLRGMRRILDGIFDTNFAANSKISASSSLRGTSVASILDNDVETFWAAENGATEAVIECELDGTRTFDVLMVQEHLLTGQRIERFELDVFSNGVWETVAQGTTIGWKRLLRFPEVTADRARLRITSSRLNPTLASFGLYDSPLPYTPEAKSLEE